MTCILDLPSEMLESIFLLIDNKYLSKICLSCTTFNNTIKDSFYTQKIIKDYGINIYKIKNFLSSRERYINLVKIKSPNVAAARGYIDILTYLKTKDILPTKYAMRIAFINGHINVIEYLLENKFDQSLIKDYIDISIGNGNIKMAEWLFDRGFKPTKKAANIAASEGNIEPLLWLRNLNILPTKIGFNFACHSGHLNIVKWLISQNINPNSKSMDFAIISNKFEIVTLFQSMNILPTKRTVNKILINGSDDQISIVKLYKYMIEKESIHELIKKGKLEILKELEILDLSFINTAIDFKFYEIVKWLLSMNITPIQHYIDILYLSRQEDIILMLKKRELFPNIIIYKSFDKIPYDLLSNIPKNKVFKYIKSLLIIYINKNNNFYGIDILKKMEIELNDSEINELFSSISESQHMKLLSKGIIPSASIYNEILFTIPILEHLHKLNILPYPDNILERYVRNKKVKEIVWFNQKNIFLSADRIDELFIMSNSLDHEYLLINDIFPSDKCLSNVRLGINCLRILKDKGIKVNESIIDNYSYDNNIAEIKFLILDGTISSIKTIKSLVYIAIRKADSTFLEWMIENKIVEYNYIFYMAIIYGKFFLIDNMIRYNKISYDIINRIMIYANENRSINIVNWLVKNNYIKTEKSGDKILFYVEIDE